MNDEKKRYLAFEIISDENFNKKNVIRGIWDQSLKVLGEMKTAESEFWLIDYDEKKSIGIFKVSKDYLEDLRFVLATINELNGKRVIIRSLRSSGIIKNLKDKYFN